MGGAGSRFAQNGWREPKPLIEIHGRPFFYWAAMSLARHVCFADITFVVLKQHVDDWNIDKRICAFFPEARIKVLPAMLPGPLFTSLAGVEGIEDDAPVVFNDCDHMFFCREANAMLNSASLPTDGVLLSFLSSSPHFSYVRYDAEGRVIGTVEKQVVSSHAICGAYMFRHAGLFREMAAEYEKRCPYKETFMSGVYNVMAERGASLADCLLDFHVEFGTPEEYAAALSSNKFESLGRPEQERCM